MELFELAIHAGTIHSYSLEGFNWRLGDMRVTVPYV